MIVVDTSALIAILRGENDATELAQALGRADRRLISAGTMLEAGIVTVQRDDEYARLMELAKRSQLEIVAVSEIEAQTGILAFRRYGRGSKHAAKLNFGDCFAYALAKTRNLPLLFKGDDFVHTDIKAVLKAG